jgi:hypothetical protein
MARLVTVATTNLNQWALDWVRIEYTNNILGLLLTPIQDGNLQRIKKAIKLGKDAGAR